MQLILYAFACSGQRHDSQSKGGCVCMLVHARRSIAGGSEARMAQPEWLRSRWRVGPAPRWAESRAEAGFATGVEVAKGQWGDEARLFEDTLI